MDVVNADPVAPERMALRRKCQHVFSALRIGTLQIKNRIALAPMASHLDDHDGMVTDAMVAWYLERAKGGIGLIISESKYVRIDGRGGVDRMGLHGDVRLPGHKRLAEAVHGHGVPIIAKCWRPSRKGFMRAVRFERFGVDV